jgi:hypothetical protein
VPRALPELSDVSLSSPVANQALVYDGVDWKNLNISIDSASDTSFANLQNGNSLVYNSGEWSNQTLSYALNDLTNVSVSSPSSGQILRFDGTNWVANTDGKILNVISTTKTDVFSTSNYAVGLGAEFADVTGVSLVITPESTTNRVLVTVSGLMAVSDSTQYVFLRLIRNVAPIAQSTGADTVNSTFFAKMTSSSDMMPFSFSFLDSPESTRLNSSH